MVREIERGRRPNYAVVPGLAMHHLVADLDRVMTVEKSVVARWNRIEGCQTDDDARRLALALARKRARTAFPDDFVPCATPLLRRLAEKHEKASDEGRALRALREIRVQARPSWDAESIYLTFWLIRGDNQTTFEGQGWDHYVEMWNRLVSPNGRFVDVEMVILELDELTAKQYIQSDPLDLDYLSSRRSTPLAGGVRFAGDVGEHS